jgi:hypothetical protein
MTASRRGLRLPYACGTPGARAQDTPHPYRRGGLETAPSRPGLPEARSGGIPPYAAPDSRTRDEVQTSSGRSSFGNVRLAPLIEVGAGDR